MAHGVTPGCFHYNKRILTTVHFSFPHVERVYILSYNLLKHVSQNAR